MLLTFIWAMLTYESVLACMLLLRAKKPNPSLPAGQEFYYLFFCTMFLSCLLLP